MTGADRQRAREGEKAKALGDPPKNAPPARPDRQRRRPAQT